MKVKAEITGQRDGGPDRHRTQEDTGGSENNMGPLSQDCHCHVNAAKDLNGQEGCPTLNGGEKMSKLTADVKSVIREGVIPGTTSGDTKNTTDAKSAKDDNRTTCQKQSFKEKDCPEVRAEKFVAEKKESSVDKLASDMSNMQLEKDGIQEVTESFKDLYLPSNDTSKQARVERGDKGDDNCGKSKKTDRIGRGPGWASAYSSHPTGQLYEVKGYYPNPNHVEHSFNNLLESSAPPNYAYIERTSPPSWGYSKKRGADDEFINMSKGLRVNQAYSNIPVEHEDFLSTPSATTASMSRLSGGSVRLQPQEFSPSDSSQDSEPCVDFDALVETLNTEAALMQHGYHDQKVDFPPPPNDLNYQRPTTDTNYCQASNMNITAEKGDNVFRPSCMYANQQNNMSSVGAIPTTVFQQDVMPPNGNLNSSPAGSYNSVTSAKGMSPHAGQSPGYKQANSPVPAYHPVPSPQDGATMPSMPSRSPGLHHSQMSGGIPSPATSACSVPSPRSYGSVPSPQQCITGPRNINQVYPTPQHQVCSPYQNTDGSPGNYSNGSPYSVASPGYGTVSQMPTYPPVASPDYSQMSPQSVQSMPSPATSQRHPSSSSTPPPDGDLNYSNPASNEQWDDLQDFIVEDSKKIDEKQRRSQRNSCEGTPPSGGVPPVGPVPTSVNQQAPFVTPALGNGNVSVVKPMNPVTTAGSVPLTTIVLPPATAGAPQVLLVMSPPRQQQKAKGPRKILPKPDPSKTPSKVGNSSPGSKSPQTGGNHTHMGPGQNGCGTKSSTNRPISASGMAPSQRKVIPPQCQPRAMLPRQYAEHELYQVRRQVSELQHEQIIAKDEEGDSLLHMVVVKRKELFLKALLERLQRNGMLELINQVNNLSQTPVYLATRTNEPAMLNMLLQHGGDPNRQARLGSCTTGGHLQMRAPIHYPASCGDDCLETLEVLLHCPILDIDQLSTEGMTALHYAAAKHGQLNQETGNKIDSTRVIMRLIQFGGDLNKRDGKSGKTPIHYIIETKDLDLIRSVFEMVPADKLSEMLKTQTFDGNTSLHIAAGLDIADIEEHKRLIRILKQNGADVSIQNGEKKAAKSMIPDNKKEIIDILKGQEENKSKRNANTGGSRNQGHANRGAMPGPQPVYIVGTVQSSPMTLVPGATPAQITPVHQGPMPGMPPMQMPMMPPAVPNMVGPR